MFMLFLSSKEKVCHAVWGKNERKKSEKNVQYIQIDLSEERGEIKRLSFFSRVANKRVKEKLQLILGSFVRMRPLVDRNSKFAYER